MLDLKKLTNANRTFMDAGRISLRQTLDAVSFVNCGDLRFSGISCDSRTIRRGELFVALPGTRVSGMEFVSSALAAGACGVLLERPLSGIAFPQAVVPDVRAAWACLCMTRREVPLDLLTIAGVTGTNGKSTTTWLLRSILEAAGQRTGLLGTIEYNDGKEVLDAGLTTPDAARIAEFLKQLVTNDIRHCVMEISSHALHQQRCAAVPLAAAAVTNVTRDHFDYHGCLDNYLVAKAELAQLLRPGQPLLVGMDDAGCRRLTRLLPPETQVLAFGMQAVDLPLRAEILRFDGELQVIQLQLLKTRLQFRTPLAGRHNVLNCLAAAGLAEQLGVDAEAIVSGLERVNCVPGRMERVHVGQPFQVFVDYAHTPDGLQHSLKTARELARGRVICVFGAGGDRDRQKRPLMASAAQTADLVIVTSDNPRSESPERIIDEIVAGFDVGFSFERITDRAAAICRSLHAAEAGDVVVVAGRGHESMQQIGTRQISFDDRRVVRRMLMEWLAVNSSTPVADRPSRNSVSEPIPA